MNSQAKEIVEQPGSPHGSEPEPESEKSNTDSVKDLSPTPASKPTQQDLGTNFIGSESRSESESKSVKDQSPIPASEPTQQDPADDSDDSDLGNYIGYHPCKRAREEGWPYLDELEGKYSRRYNGEDPKYVDNNEDKEKDRKISNNHTRRRPILPDSYLAYYLRAPWMCHDFLCKK